MRKKILAAILTTLALCATAMAVWYLQGKTEGQSAPTKNGKATPTVVPIKVSFNEGLMAGAHEALEATVENNATGAVEDVFHNIVATVTSAEPTGCPATNMRVYSTSAFWQQALEAKQTVATKIAAGAVTNLNTTFGAGLEVELLPTAPQGCEGVSMTIKLVAS
jgi:hypothetical protein